MLGAALQIEAELIDKVAVLEDKATSFANTASRIGERLETLDSAKLRAHKCAELMRHLGELQEADKARRAACFSPRPPAPRRPLVALSPFLNAWRFLEMSFGIPPCLTRHLSQWI